MRTTLRRAAMLAVLTTLAACGSPTSSPSAGASPASAAGGPRFETVDCPDDVRHGGVDPMCGYVTVPENRAVTDGPVVRLFIVRQRPSGELKPDPVLVIEEPGWDHKWQDRDALPARIHRETIQFERRGVGRSEPSLACLEIEAAVPEHLRLPIGGAEPAPGLMDPVRACHDRLVAAGIDLASYGVEALAADAEDVRTALGIETWNLRAKAGGARLAFEILRRYPGHVRAAWLDSPEVPEVDFLTTAILGTRYAVDEVSRACTADTTCHSAFPDVPGSLAATLAADSAMGHTSFDGSVLDVWEDQSYTARAVRFGLAVSPDVMPAALAFGATGGVSEEPEDWIGQQPPFTLGYQMDQWDVADASRVQLFSHGAWFSSICRDQMAFVDHAALGKLAAGDPGYVPAYVESPFDAICSIWDVGKADPVVHEPLTSDVPILLMVGQFDPYGPRPLVEQAARTLSRSQVVVVPNYGHNVLGLDCPVSIRNAWLDAPTAAPDTNCLGSIPALRFQGT
jgi:pimeloyl-ACP methyl ester carboxylesterase